MARNLLRVGGLIFAILVAIVAGLWISGKYSLSPRDHSMGRYAKSSAVIAVADLHALDLGEVWENSAITRNVTVENRGGEPVRVTGFLHGCKRLVSEPEMFDLKPGASQVIQIKLDLSLSPQTPLERVAFSSPLRVNYTTLARDGERVESIGQFSGFVKPILLTHSVWNLGSLSREYGVIEKTFEVGAALPLEQLDLDLGPNPPAWLRVSMAPSRSDPRLLLVTVYADITKQATIRIPSVLSANLTLRPIAVDGERLAPRAIVVETEIVSDVQISPAELDFGAASIRSVQMSLVNVSSLSGRAVLVKKVELNGEGLEVGAGGRANEFCIKQSVSRLGAVSTTAWLTVQTSSGEERIALPIKATGVEMTNP